MTKIEVTGKVIPSGVLDKKFVQGENKMEKIQFALPLNYGGVDMAAMNYTLRLANVAGTVTSAALAKTVADKVNLEWTVTEDFVRMPGNCRIELDGVDADGVHKFLAVSAWFDVLKNLGRGSNLPPKDEITAALESMQVYLSGAAESAEEAKRWAEQSAAASAEIEQQLQDAVDVTQALTDKTTEAQGVVDELGDMLAEADLSQYVTKTGTSVVTGDLQVPAPATADSAVNREYADGNGYTQARNDTLPYTVSNTIYKNGWRYAPITVLANSYITDENNKYCLLFTCKKTNGAYRFWGAIGQYQRTKSIDLVLYQTSTNVLTVNNISPMNLNDSAMGIVITKDNDNHYIYAKKKAIQWAIAQIQCQQYLAQTSVIANDTYEWVDAPIGTEVWNSDGQTSPGLVPKDYADAVPYQYAKKAGFRYSEDIFKKNLKFEPFIIDKNFSATTTNGYCKIATCKFAIGSVVSASLLVVSGWVREYTSTTTFTLKIAGRAANNVVDFQGTGYTPNFNTCNLVLVKNSDNFYELYFEKTSIDTKYTNVYLEMTYGSSEAWDFDTSNIGSLTPGTIPGTKVWDLKTAWGTTSRTQVIKEDVCANNAGAHNAIYRGKNLGTSVTAAQYAAIADGTFKDLFIGDYWVIDGVRWYIAHIDYYKNVRAKKIHHLLIVPGGTIGSAQMNSTATTINGYWGSEMRSTNILPALEKIKGIFGNYIMPHDIIMPAKSDSNGQVTKEEWVTVSIGALMNAYMVFGFNPQYIRNNDPVKSTICESGQLALFRYSIEQLWIGAAWWLRDISSGTNFVNVHVTNCVSTDLANIHSGIRPYFCLAGTPQTQTAANSIPAAAPSLEKSSEEEEEITV